MGDIVTFNCRSVKKNIHIVKELCNKFKLIALQETLLPQQDSDFLNTIHDKFSYIASSPVDLRQGLLRGRPYGGLAFLFKSEIASQITFIPTNNERLLCIDMNVNGIIIRIVNCYLPYFNGTNISDYIDLLGKINCLFKEHVNNHVIALGDFNAHPSGEFGEELRGFCGAYNYCIADMSFLPQDSHTWISDSTGHTRWLDHILCPNSLLNCLNNFKIHYNEIGSDHKPLSFNFSLSLSSNDSEVKKMNKRVKYEVTNKEKYEIKTEIKLKEIELPVEAILCKNHMHCNNPSHLHQIETFANNITNALIQSGEKVIHETSKKSQNIPGWNEFVKDFHESAREKYLFWVNLGKPRNGLAYHQMRATKKDFKKALDACKGMKEVIIRNKIAKDMKQNKPWPTINKIRSKKTKLPTTVDGVTGEGAIAELWKEIYSDSMSGKNHPKIDASKNDDDEKNNISIPNVTVKDVQEAMKNLSLTSSPGLDQISGNHLKYAHKTLLLLLSLLFTVLFTHSYVPITLTNIKICNLIKDLQKSSSISGNYRPIALASLLSKLFECIILQRSGHLLTTTDNQFAYKQNHSTDMALFLLKTTIESCKSTNSPIFLCTMDLSKAFDRVCHKKLFEILSKRKVPPYIIATLKHWYLSQEFRVMWGNELSSPFKTGCGIRQGSVLSAVLFAVYMNDLSSEIFSDDVGCVVGGQKINHILYADDIILLSTSAKSLQYLVNKCVTYLDNHLLTINTQKTKVMSILPKQMIKYNEPEIVIKGNHLEVVDSFKYLGMQINNRMKDDEHITTLYRGQCLRGNLLVRNFHMCDQDAKVHLFKSFCTSLYGIPLSFNCKKETLNKLKVCYNNSFRFLMRIGRMCSVSEKFVILGIPTFKELVRKCTASLYMRLKSSKNSLVLAVFNSWFFKNSSTFNLWTEMIHC